MPQKSSNKRTKFSVATVNEAAKVASAFRVMMTTEGWKYLIDIIDDNISVLEKMVMTKTDSVTGEAMTDIQVEGCRIKWSYLNEIRGTPQKFVEALENPQERTEPEYDPYFKSVDELIRSRKAR